MNNNSNLRNLIKDKFQLKQNRISARRGVMGNGFGVVGVPSRINYVYIRIGDTIEEVFNNRVPTEDNLLVNVGYDPIQPALYQVISTSTAAPGGITGGAIGGYAPAIRYQWMASGGGEDPLWVEKRQFLPLRVGAYSGLSIMIYRDVVWTGTSWNLVDSQLFDLTSFIPSTLDTAAWVLITVDTTGAVIGTKGTELSNAAYPGLDLLPTVPTDTREVLGAVRVYYGQIAIREERDYTDVVDLRFSWAAAGGGIGEAPEDGTPYARQDAGWVADSGGDGVVLGTATPQPLGTAVAGSSETASHEDHVHVHSNLAGGDLHAVADDSAAGFMPILPNDAATYLNGTGAFSIPTTSSNLAPAWFLDGVLDTGSSLGGGLVIAQAATISNIYIYLKTPGASSSTIIDIHKNGTTIFTTQGNRPTLAYNDADHVASATPDVVSLTAGDVLTLDIDQLAPGAAALTVVIEVEAGATGAVTGGGWVYACGRLTLTSGTPITTADVTAATTLYFTPYLGGKIGLFDGSSTWNIVSFSEISLSLAALVNAKPYDIFCYSNSGAATLEALVWTNTTTRATALTTQDGILVKSGATTRRYLGTIYTSAAGQCEDSQYRRFVWNYYNQKPRALSVFDATVDWTYATNTWRSANGNTGNRVEFVLGVSETPISAKVLCWLTYSSGTSYAASIGIGVDSTSTNSATLFIEYGGNDVHDFLSAIAEYYNYLPVGYHYFQWLEKVRGGTVKFTGNDLPNTRSGLIASVMG